ncbi:unnamed protein product [Adineta steineri]|uniref:Uncharacterized protein n=1 Tax=Adineta steineri TaxID=433720 RepID=A0A815CM05_9BILA|nr:unnamed protein product [Adineta steineri]CAF1285552.1 unnamed protein product [Adineta steineri]
MYIDKNRFSTIDHTGERVIGVGVDGLALSGGYEWKLNHYGLAIDNIYFNMKHTLLQTEVYEGVLYYGPSEIDQVLAAILNFQNNNTDSKA